MSCDNLLLQLFGMQAAGTSAALTRTLQYTSALVLIWAPVLVV